MSLLANATDGGMETHRCGDLRLSWTHLGRGARTGHQARMTRATEHEGVFQTGQTYGNWGRRR